MLWETKCIVLELEGFWYPPYLHMFDMDRYLIFTAGDMTKTFQRER